MPENPMSSPVFAGRYRFQPVGNDWDTGRSGFTHLVFDMNNERLGVIKRAETKSAKAVEGLKNEVASLLDLKGFNVPQVYDTGEAEYGSKTYFYVVIEYIDGIRIEKQVKSLNNVERTEILTQLFGLLAQAHDKGIVNGDIDLKHLFWRRDKNQLVVIDWGNSKHGVGQNRQSEFAYDLARSAEIIFSLVTRIGRPPASGSIALPDDPDLITGLAPLPIEFHSICEWAPRTPTDSPAYHTAMELFIASQQWTEAIQNNIPYQPRKPQSQINGTASSRIFRLFTLLFLVLALLGGYQLSKAVLIPPTTDLAETSSPTHPDTPTDNASPTATPIVTPTFQTSTAIHTLAPIISPSPETYTGHTLVLDKNFAFEDDSPCWINTTNLSAASTLQPNEGFYKRDDDVKNFGFRVAKGRSIDEFIQTDFETCFEGNRINAIALNAWIPRLELQRDSPDELGETEPGKEFGLFLQSSNGYRREYTIWIDKVNSMHLRIREDNNIVHDDTVLVISEENLRIMGSYPRLYAVFPIQMFLEIDNQGLDIIYLRKGPLQLSVDPQEIDPSQMIRIETAVFPTIGNIQSSGLIGYGGETQIVVWPLAFLQK